MAEFVLTPQIQYLPEFDLLSCKSKLLFLEGKGCKLGTGPCFREWIEFAWYFTVFKGLNCWKYFVFYFLSRHRENNMSSLCQSHMFSS